jgi:hypothetical protein|tara:strand:- start:1034 stop:1210 length:177 start_codon:yes stop_codon:yes gene_type:complete
VIQKEKRIVFTKRELWLNQAPSLNFQFDEDELLKEALKRGFVTKIGQDKYLVNNEYDN